MVIVPLIPCLLLWTPHEHTPTDSYALQIQLKQTNTPLEFNRSSPISNRGSDFILHNSGIHFVEIIDLLKQDIAIIDPQGFIISVNRAWYLHSLEIGVPESFEWTGVNFAQIYNALAGDEGHPPHELEAVLDGTNPFLCKEFKSSSRLETKCFTLEASTIYSPDGNSVKGGLVCLTDITQSKLLEQNHLKALAQICTLHGLLPICAVCKKIRDEHDIWNSIESFLEKHTKVEFTHDICPECIRRLYPEYSSLLDKSSCS